MLPDAAFDPAEVHYAAVWKPAPGELAAFPNLRVIFNLGAGVDALMADKSLPNVPLVRVAVGDLTYRMTEYVVLHVLMHHRQELYLRACQREKRWAPKFQRPSSEVSVGIMGLGNLGADAAQALRHLRFRVAGWSRSPKAIDGVDCFHGHGAARCVSGADRHPGLPLAAHAGHAADPQSRIVRKAFPQRPAGRAGPDQCRARRPAERGRHSRLSRRRHARRGLARCVRDRSRCRPDSRFWTHPKVVLTPHNAADTDPDEISKYVARQIERFEAGGALENVVDPARGY